MTHHMISPLPVRRRFLLLSNVDLFVIELVFLYLLLRKCQRAAENSVSLAIDSSCLGRSTSDRKWKCLFLMEIYSY